MSSIVRQARCCCRRAAVSTTPVNVAARLETLTKDYPEYPILINGLTARALTSRNDLTLKNLGPIQVKGHTEPVDVYAVVGWQAPTLVLPSIRSATAGVEGNGMHRTATRIALVLAMLMGALAVVAEGPGIARKGPRPYGDRLATESIAL